MICWCHDFNDISFKKNECSLFLRKSLSLTAADMWISCFLWCPEYPIVTVYWWMGVEIPRRKRMGSWNTCILQGHCFLHAAWKWQIITYFFFQFTTLWRPNYVRLELSLIIWLKSCISKATIRINWRYFGLLLAYGKKPVEIVLLLTLYQKHKRTVLRTLHLKRTLLVKY
jgi:hypothetical protein